MLISGFFGGVGALRRTEKRCLAPNLSKFVADLSLVSGQPIITIIVVGVSHQSTSAEESVVVDVEVFREWIDSRQ